MFFHLNPPRTQGGGVSSWGVVDQFSHHAGHGLQVNCLRSSQLIPLLKFHRGKDCM